MLDIPLDELLPFIGTTVKAVVALGIISLLVTTLIDYLYHHKLMTDKEQITREFLHVDDDQERADNKEHV